jgi:hypothetical protein
MVARADFGAILHWRSDIGSILEDTYPRMVARADFGAILHLGSDICSILDDTYPRMEARADFWGHPALSKS